MSPNGYFEITQHGDYVEVVRTTLQFDVSRDLYEVCRPCIEHLEDLRHLGLLFDLRRATGRVEPEFEQKIARARQDITWQHPYVAFLVHTAVGMLQVSRLLREDGAGPQQRVFCDEEKARTYARGLLRDSVSVNG